MSYSIEQEIKGLLSQHDFNQLLNYFELGANDFITQRNIYYDTITQDLKNNHAALRLRNFTNKSEWTYKQRQDDFRSLELTHHLDYLQLPAPTSLSLSDIEDHVIADQLRAIIDKDLTLYAFLTIKTDRWIIPISQGEIALDRTFYGDTVDYEIELETNVLEEGKEYFHNLLLSLEIPYLPAEKKIARASQYLNS